MGATRLPSLPAAHPLADYWHQAARPLVSLAFVAPMLVAYEAGLLWLGPQAMRNGADVWLRHWLELLGFSQYFLLPFLTCGILLAWHHVSRQSWRVGSVVLYGMLLESMACGFLLVVLARIESSIWGTASGDWGCALTAARGPIGQMIAFFGAGIYEELLFRLILLPALVAMFRLGGLPRGTSLAVAVVLSSLLFAAAHYRVDVMIGDLHLVTSLGDPFQWTSFLFRLSAGVVFSVLFVYRGFGIAAGTHALYDILAALT